MKAAQTLIPLTSMIIVSHRHFVTSSRNTPMFVVLKNIFKKIGYFAMSLWLVFHVFAVFISPAAMPPASPLLEDGYEFALPYNEALFLNHGYHYFAPDPGSSTLISWQIPHDGEAPVVGRFPDVAIHPRLMYHRYFMLAENIWAFDEEMQADVLKAYARHLAGRFGADQISLTRVSHEPSSILRLQAGGKLDDVETFQHDLLGDFDFSDPTTDPNSTVVGNF